ncbi:hypothetical protein CDQ74_06460 [Campylobacter hyointestinalis subsp. hyointestinalis]|uniref:Uncharacterized protein n=2 Tax=Campylobacter hyointestinalis subsp. hyointestinalis TaxID=91352 RepID=A0A2S5J5L3_CAMHY|nr:hypothetical protein CDQ67_05695 [Campylobacter hyointestinalis subsp. hyointestinalis]TWO22970.1 DUF2393 domain-containing protein [Campylobacter hyointestinalis]PPB57668.1 hypothetical protein CDQ71_06475 [Campylobacter hyointestinalis subsp. hyointestinalis]PPB57787.1 hypothetical protein CDQ70_06765 [Campylobacter hyointestinalis subsp. hyointestinalis]PPB62623.1 hypothetical protein CDQ74_06460 [Campylobacter hyointestinalis subsp. hyointestinalis]
MMYFTIFHIIALVVICVLFILFLILALKEERISVIISMVGLNIFVMTCLAIFAMLSIDQYTKKARIENLNYDRVLLNESMVFFGTIRNIGDYTITSCTLEMKLTNSPVEKGVLDGNIFKQKGFLDTLKSKPEARSSVEMEFKIGTNLKPSESRAFSVSLPYPATFRTPTYHYKLYCH